MKLTNWLQPAYADLKKTYSIQAKQTNSNSVYRTAELSNKLQVASHSTSSSVNSPGHSKHAQSHAQSNVTLITQSMRSNSASLLSGLFFFLGVVLVISLVH